MSRRALAWAVLVGVVVLGLLAPSEGQAASRTRARHVGVVNLNEATVAELSLLPGVGEKAALRIVEQRQKRRFQRVEELVRVKGFGRKKFLRLKPLLAVAGPTTLKVEQVAVNEPPAQPAPAAGPAPAARPAAEPPRVQARLAPTGT